MPEFFHLQEGEQIIKEIKPLPSLKWYFFLKDGGTILALILFLASFIIYAVISTEVPSLPLILFWTGLFIIIFFTTLIVAYLKYSKQYYWITNKRIIYRHGIIGYKIRSVPLERISDVIISRTFLEKLLGFGSILIETLAGQVGEEQKLLAVPNPEEIQELIFELLKRKRAEEGIRF